MAALPLWYRNFTPLDHEAVMKTYEAICTPEDYAELRRKAGMPEILEAVEQPDGSFDASVPKPEPFKMTREYAQHHRWIYYGVNYPVQADAMRIMKVTDIA